MATDHITERSTKEGAALHGSDPTVLATVSMITKSLHNETSAPVNDAVKDSSRPASGKEPVRIPSASSQVDSTRDHVKGNPELVNSGGDSGVAGTSNENAQIKPLRSRSGGGHDGEVGDGGGKGVLTSSKRTPSPSKSATPSGAKEMTPSKPHFARLPSPGPEMEGQRLHKLSARTKYPPQMLRLATVTVRSRLMKPKHKRSLYIDQPREQTKVVTWDQATNARPPLRIDMDGPDAWSYSPVVKPTTERNSPAWSFGRRTFVEKDGGSRRSWSKTWFQTEDVWHQKTDFSSDQKWPAPPTYRKKPTMGPKQNTVAALVAPSYTIGVRDKFSIEKQGASREPAPNEYNREPSDSITLRRAPAFTVGLRRGGTVLWTSSPNAVPGPGRYNPRMMMSMPHKPSFSICGVRRSKAHELGPFSTM